MTAVDEPEIVVESRESLAYLLAEAAEIEHGLMCCYLYAAFSLGGRRHRELPAAQAAAVARWRDAILAVARDEMIHLALVSNLLNAIGAAPHLSRPNFPVSPGAHPAGVVVSLAPFSAATIDHFVYLERPEGSDEHDGDGFAPGRAYQRGMRAGRLVPNAQDYLTVGHLYRGIEHGLTDLAARIGEAALFCGDPRLQVSSTTIGLPATTPITDLASALAAIRTIVDQGEGAPGHAAGSHYARFLQIRDELRELTASDPGFAPAATVARNPVMRRPPMPAGLLWIDAEPAATVLDVGNALYAFTLRSLGVLFSPVSLTRGARELAAEAMALAMRALTPVAELLTELPASTTVPEVTAGLSFTTSRALEPLPEAPGAFRTLHEAAARLATAMQRDVLPLAPALARFSGALDDLAGRLRELAEQAPAEAVTPRVHLPVVQAAPAPASASAEPGIEEATRDGVVLRFEARRCIHARICVTGAPGVFLANVAGPWLHPETTSIEDLVMIARGCPSGAITYRRLDGGPDEAPPPRNVIRIRENGPYAVHANLLIAGEPPLLRAVLCRCGASQHKPFCDGSHNAAGFVATGEPPSQSSEPLVDDGRALHVGPQPDGPLAISGPVEICSGTGRNVHRVEGARLCRCGGSQNKPFCDGSHARIGFRS